MSESTTPIPAEAVEAAARAAAILDDYDGCFERVDEYEALLVQFPGEYESGAERPDSDYEDCEWWRVRAQAALAAAAPVLLTAERERAWDEGYLVGDPHQRRGDPAKAPNPYRAVALTEGPAT